MEKNSWNTNKCMSIIVSLSCRYFPIEWSHFQRENHIHTEAKANKHLQMFLFDIFIFGLFRSLFFNGLWESIPFHRNTPRIIHRIYIYICISIVSHNDTEKTAYKHYNGIFGIVFHIGWHDFHSILMYTWWMGMGMRAILYLYKCAIRLNHNIPKIRLNLKVFRLCGTSHSNSNSTIIRPESLASHPQNPIYAKYSPRFFKSDIENGNNFAFLTQTDLCSQFLSFFPFHPLRLTYSLFVQSLA